MGSKGSQPRQQTTQYAENKNTTLSRPISLSRLPLCRACLLKESSSSTPPTKTQPDLQRLLATFMSINPTPYGRIPVRPLVAFSPVHPPEDSSLIVMRGEAHRAIGTKPPVPDHHNPHKNLSYMPGHLQPLEQLPPNKDKARVE